ncbi:MAG TPA: ABC transporter substrate-binding protein, partial [Candidatus Binatia bacterium]
YDVGEYSAATFMRTREKGKPFVALPIFFERGPRQRNIFYREGNLSSPADLKGKKIGCFRYGATAVVWERGYLLDEHGLKTTDMTWYVSGKEVFIGQDLPVKVERLEPPTPFGQEKAVLSRLVSEGVLHAALVAGDMGYFGIFGGGTLPKAMGEFAGVKPLFDDTDDAIRWIKRTRLYPIIHLIAMKEEAAEKYPDLPAKLVEAFRAAKRAAPKYMKREEIEGYEKEAAVVGEDPYECVLGDIEKRTLQALNRYQIEQGLMRKELPLESCFVRGTFK